MKKIYFSALALILAASVNAQVANGGLETWTDGEPDSWNTYNPLMEQASQAGGTVTIAGNSATTSTDEGTGDASEGSSYARLTSFTLTGLSGAGIPDGIYNGQIDQYVVTSTKYESIKFSYRANLIGGDTAIAFVTASGPGHDFGQNAIGQAVLEVSANKSGWTDVTVPINWLSPDPIDSIQVLFGTTKSAIFGGPSPSADSTVFEIDGVELYEPSSGIENLSMNTVSVYPNPATDVVNFNIDGLENGTVVINSVTGQEVVNTTISNGSKTVDVSALNNGVYIYSIRNNAGETIKTQKLVIRK